MTTQPARPAITAILPTTLAQARALAKQLAGSAAVPVALRGKPDDLLAIILAGAELGIPPMRATANLYIGEQGKVLMSADCMVGICLSRGGAIWCSDDRDTFTTYNATRAEGTMYSWTWSDQDTIAAGLADRPWWVAYTKQMRHARASAAVARRAFPDVLAGIYCTEEARDFAPAAGGPGGAQDDVPTFRADQPARAPRSFVPDVEDVPRYDYDGLEGNRG